MIFGHGVVSLIQISADGTTSQNPRFSACAASKTGAVALAATLAEGLGEGSIDVNSIGPGGLATRMNDKSWRPAQKISAKLSAMRSSNASTTAGLRDALAPS